MDCPICDHSSAVPFTVKDARQLLICESCRHIWFERMPANRELSDYYEAEYTSNCSQESLQESEAAYYRDHAAELREIVGQPMAIADIGCSIPVFLREAAEASSKRVGVDLSAEAHDLGKKWGVDMVTPAQFVEVIPDESLDVLRYSHVLEHLPDPVGTLEQQISKVKQGGLVYVTQPNFPVFRAEFARVELHDSVWPSHLHFFNPLSVAAMFQRVGLKLFRFLTHHEERECMTNYGRFMDLVAAADRLEEFKPITIEYGTFTGWPFYAGKNSGCFALKETALGT